MASLSGGKRSRFGFPQGENLFDCHLELVWAKMTQNDAK
jgi:hypothetical protein